MRSWALIIGISTLVVLIALLEEASAARPPTCPPPKPCFGSCPKGLTKCRKDSDCDYGLSCCKDSCCKGGRYCVSTNSNIPNPKSQPPKCPPPKPCVGSCRKGATKCRKDSDCDYGLSCCRDSCCKGGRYCVSSY